MKTYLTIDLTRNEARTLMAQLGNTNGNFGSLLYNVLVDAAPELHAELNATQPEIFSAGVLDFRETEKRLISAGLALE